MLAKQILLDEVEKTHKEDLLLKIQKVEKTDEQELEKKAHQILALAVQRCSMNHTSEITSSIID